MIRKYIIEADDSIKGFDEEIARLEREWGAEEIRWIPVTERLPEDYIHVLCQFTLSGMGECYLAHGVFHVVGGLVMTCNEVIAWMPLPEPYQSNEYNGSGYDTAENCKLIKSMPSVTSQQIRWIPVSERAADFPCLACDIFKQIFIPSGIVVLNNRCYDGKDFDFNVEKFLKGKEITTYGGEKLYVKPREITAWMPLPEPYQSND